MFTALVVPLRLGLRHVLRARRAAAAPSYVGAAGVFVFCDTTVLYTTPKKALQLCTSRDRFPGLDYVESQYQSHTFSNLIGPNLTKTAETAELTAVRVAVCDGSESVYPADRLCLRLYACCTEHPAVGINTIILFWLARLDLPELCCFSQLSDFALLDQCANYLINQRLDHSIAQLLDHSMPCRSLSFVC